MSGKGWPFWSLLITLSPRLSESLVNDFADCQDDYTLKPADGILMAHTFTWLGFVQYMHTTTGLPHASKAPRVVLMHKQFVMGTAADLLRLPHNYKLGNIIFGDYERDEDDCGLSKSQVKMGITCGRAYLEMPIADIIPHPEYTRFGVGTSLALVKLIRPMKSHYMVPVCFPTVIEREKQRKRKVVMLVDYISSVPRDFDSEKMAKKSVKLYTHKDCRRHRMRSRLGSEGVTHVLCTSGCGVRPGAPIIIHAQTGTFELVGLNAGGAPCSRRQMRHRLNSEPPIYIDVYPYNTWIVNVITAHLLPKTYPHQLVFNDPQGNVITRKHGFLRQSSTKRIQRHGWRAKTYVAGDLCYSRMSKSKIVSAFYDELFEVAADPPAKLNIFMEIIATMEATILCAKIKLPNRKSTPVFNGIGGYNISMELNTEWFPYAFYFTLTLQARNTTPEQLDAWLFEKYGAENEYDDVDEERVRRRSRNRNVLGKI